MAIRKRSAKVPTKRGKQRLVPLGIRGWRVPLHSHISYLWNSDEELAEAVGFLGAGLRGKDHCLLAGSSRARNTILDLLRERGLDVEELRAAGRIDVLGGAPSAEGFFASIAGVFRRGIAAGAPLIRFLGVPGWGEQDWPDQASLLSFEARLTRLARRFPSVTLCLYDVRSLPGGILEQGGFRRHPLVICSGQLVAATQSVPPAVFVMSVAHAVQSVAERKRAEEALAESERRFAKVFHVSPVALAMSTITEGRIIDVNERWLELFGYRRDDVIGRTNRELGLSVDPEARIATVRRVRDEGILRNLEVQVRRKSGEVRQVMVSAVPLDLAGEGDAWISAQVDITDRKRAEAERDRLLESLEALSRRLVQVQEAERAEIARELHDEVGQLLTGLRLMVETGDSSTEGRGVEMKRIVNELIAMVRDLSVSLRPPMLDALGLLPALLWQIERFEAQSRIHVAFHHANLDRRFRPEVETAAFRIVQEALTNAARHASVERVEVELTAEARRLLARIQDRGRGFDVNAALAGPSSGLAGMRERARLARGRLTIESAAGSGTRLRLVLPLSDTDAGRADK